MKRHKRVSEQEAIERVLADNGQQQGYGFEYDTPEEARLAAREVAKEDLYCELAERLGLSHYGDSLDISEKMTWPFPEAVIAYQVGDYLQRKYNQKSSYEVCSDAGRTDILTRRLVIEVKVAILKRGDLYRAVGQVLMYRASLGDSRRPIIVARYVENYLPWDVVDLLGIRAYKWNGNRLKRITYASADRGNEKRLAGARKGAEISRKLRMRQAREFYADLLPDMQKMRSEGLSLAKIANALTTQGYTTRRGRAWNPMQVKLVLDREAYSHNEFEKCREALLGKVVKEEVSNGQVNGR